MSKHYEKLAGHAIRLCFLLLVLLLIQAWTHANAESIPVQPVSNVGRIILPESTSLLIECESGLVVTSPEPTSVFVSCHRAFDEEN